MQCYENELLCRALVHYVRERDPTRAIDVVEASEIIESYGIDSVTQLADLVSIARNVCFGFRLAA